MIWSSPTKSLRRESALSDRRSESAPRTVQKRQDAPLEWRAPSLGPPALSCDTALMNWLTNFVRPKLRALVTRKETPENLWLKCPKCEQMLFVRDWEANQEVCNHCGHHMRILPLKRLPFLFDDGKYELHPLPKVTLDPLKFRDTKRYDARLKEAQAKNDGTGE